MIESYDRKKNVKNIMLKFEELGFKDRVKNEKEAANIEYSVLEFSKEYVETNNIEFMLEQVYNDKIEEFINLLSKELITKIFEKIIDSKKIAFMKEDELNPQKFSKVKSKKKKEDDIINNPKSVSSYKCKNCGGKRTKIKEEQILRADEPATVIITCLDCGYVEKQT